MAMNIIVSTLLSLLEKELINLEPDIAQFLKDEIDAIGNMLLDYLNKKFAEKDK
jgi:hypothetical protein